MEKTKLAVVLFLVITCQASADSTVLQGNQITVGIDNTGYLINSDEGYGIDYTAGDGQYGRDFLLDSIYPWEGYSIGVGGNVFTASPDFVYPDIYSPQTESTLGSTNAVTTGTAYYTSLIPNSNETAYNEMGLSFSQNVSISNNSSVIDIQVVLTNYTSDLLTDIVYARFMDPDQDSFPNGTNNTNSTVHSEDLVDAAQVGANPDPDWTIAINSTSGYDHNASIYYPGTTDPYFLMDWDEQTHFLIPLFEDNADFSIAMAWDIDQLESGESATIDFQYIIGEREGAGVPPSAPIPVPGAFMLGSIGIGCVTLLRKRKII